MTASESRSGVVLELAEEFLDRYRRGERPAMKDYIARHPDLADEIRAVFPAMAMMEQIALADDSLEGDPTGPGVAVGEATPEQLGDYLLIREVGRGGMGVVYEAEQVSLGRHVALKVLPPRRLDDVKTRRRFEREARAAARLHHTNIVPVFGVGEHGQTPYYVMQYIQGQGLDAVLEELKRLRSGADPIEAGSARSAVGGDVSAADVARSLLTGRFDGQDVGPGGSDDVPPPTLDVSAGVDQPASDSAISLSPSSATLSLPTSAARAGSRRPTYWQGVARIGAEVADALEYAHQQGIIHRDIKPSNLLLDTLGTIWVTDFGLAKADDQQDLTQTGDVLGTLRYMPPEAFEGSADHRGDVYSLGLTLYELLAFRPAFGEKDRGRLIRRVTTEEPSRLGTANPDVPRDLETIVHKAIDRDPAHRYASAAALAGDLQRFLDDEPIQARRQTQLERLRRLARRHPGIAILGATLLAVLVVATAASLAVAGRMARLARDKTLAAAVARREANAANLARGRETEQRRAAEAARNAALDGTYGASISEARALRAAHRPGWRDEALGNLARLAILPAPRRDLVELRNDAVACLGDFDIHEVARLDESKGVAFGLDFLADGPTLASAHRNGVIHLWDAANPAHLATLPGEGPVGNWNYPSWSEPRPVVSRRPDGKGLFYNPRGHGAVSLGPDLRPDRPPIDRQGMNANGLSCDATGRRLAIGWADNRVEVFEVATGARLLSVAVPSLAFALSPDGLQLALIGPGNSILLRSVEEDRKAEILGRQRAEIRSVAFSPDGATVATASNDGTVMLWDVARREARFPLRGHKGPVSVVKYSPDGEWIVTGGNDLTARVWDARSGRELAVLDQYQYSVAAAFSPGGGYLATAEGFHYWFHLYQITGRRERMRLIGHLSSATAVAFHPRLARLASGDDSGGIILWDSAAGVRLGKWKGAEQQVQALAFSPDGSILASGGYGAKLLLLNAEDGSLLRSLSGHAGVVTSLAFDRAGTRIASGSANGHVLIHEVATGAKLPPEIGMPMTVNLPADRTGETRRLTGESPGVQLGSAWIPTLDFTDDGRQLLVQPIGGQLTVVDLSGKPRPRSTWVPGHCQSMVSDFGRARVVIGGVDGGLAAVSLPDLKTGLRVLGHHRERVMVLARSPDGKLIASGGADGQVVLSDAGSLQPLLRFPRRSGWVLTLAFDSSGDRLAVGGHDADLEMWDLRLLRAGLEAAGLAWDRPAPAVDPNSGIRPPARAGSGNAPLIAAEPGAAAAAAYRVALRLKPDDAVTRVKLAEALRLRGNLDASVAELREALRLEPDLVLARSRLEAVLNEQDEAIAELRATIRVQPGSGKSYRDLAIALQARGKPDEAMAVGREALRAEAWTLLELATFYHSSNRYAAEAELFAEAYAADPKLRDDRASGRPFKAAVAAALAGLGQGDDNPKPDAKARARLRRQALDWFRAILALHTALAASGRANDAWSACYALDVWKSNPSLAGVREDHPLLELPEAERAAWQGLWADVDAVIARTETSPFVVAHRFRSLEQHAAAARAYALGLAEPLVAGLARYPLRYQAACSAALAGSGLGDDDPKPDADARAGLRRQALDWLRADLALRSADAASGRADGAAGDFYVLRRWKSAPELTGVRDAKPLSDLPEAERAAWEAFWADVDAAIKQTSSPSIAAIPFVAAERHRSLKQYAAAARSYAEGLARSLIPEDRMVSWRYKAALSAAQAGSGLGDDDPKPDDSARARLRRQSLGWLEDNLRFRKEGMASGAAEAIQAARNAALLWKGLDELACVREADALAKLPEAERAAWQAFWAEVDAMQAQADAASAKP